MTTFANGDGTLKQSTKMGALLELCQLHNQEESNQSVASRLNMTSTDEGVFNVTMLNPITKTRSGEGVLYVPEDYLPGFVFDPGIGGDLTATTLPGALVQLVEIISSTDGGSDRITANSINTAGSQNISLNINTTTVLNTTTGVLEITAVDDV